MGMRGPNANAEGGSGPGRLDRSSPLPLWAQIQDLLTRRLGAGEFGDAFPTELALQREYGVSRHTVRAALAELRAEGMVIAERGRGSRVVAEATVEQPLGALYSLFRSVEATGRQQRSVVRVLDERADGVVATRLRREESTPLVHLERLRLCDGEPLAVDRVWLPAELARPLLDADFGHTSLYDELTRRCSLRVSGGQERITAVTPTRAEQTLLGLPAGQPAALRIERLGCASGRPVEWRTTVVRGDRFALTASWSPAVDYQLAVESAPLSNHLERTT